MSKRAHTLPQKTLAVDSRPGPTNSHHFADVASVTFAPSSLWTFSPISFSAAFFFFSNANLKHGVISPANALAF